jgi:hypothetical protein
MTARENPARDPAAGAAVQRPGPARELGRTDIRSKPARVTAGLDPATYTGLNRWVGSAAIAVNPDFPRLPSAKAIRAMIHATTASEAVAGAVLEQLRQGQYLARHDAHRRRGRHIRIRRADDRAA